MRKQNSSWLRWVLSLVLFWMAGVSWGVDLGELHQKGIARYERTDIQGALSYWMSGLQLAKKQNNRQAETAFLGNIGSVYGSLGQYPEALEHYQKALTIVGELGDRRGKKDILFNLGNVYTNLGQYPEALEHYRQALAIAQDYSDHKGEGDIRLNLGVVYRNLGLYTEALENYRQALAIAQEYSDHKGEGKIFGNLGAVLWTLGQYDEALENYRQALSIARKFSDRNGEGIVLTNLGLLYRNFGHYSEALEHYRQALTIAREFSDRRGEGDIRVNIGVTYWRLGRYHQALGDFQQALVIARDLSDSQGEGVVLNNIGSMHSSLGQYDKALEHFRQALAIKRASSDPKGEGAVLNNIGYVYSSLEQYDEALEHFRQALAIYNQLDVPEMLNAEANIGDVHLEQEQYAEALVIFQRLDTPIHLGRYYLKIKDYSQAQRYFSKHFQQIEETPDAAYLLATHIGLGLSNEGLKEYDQARRHYRKAVDLIEVQRDQLGTAERRHFFEAKVMGFPRLIPYEGLARIAAKQGRSAASFHWSEHTKARVLLEDLASKDVDTTLGLPPALAVQEAELNRELAVIHKQIQTAREQDDREFLQEREKRLEELKSERQDFIARLRASHPQYAAIQYPEPVRLADLKLEPNEVLIQYEVTDRATLAWLVKDDKVRQVREIPLDREDLTEQVRRYRRVFEDIASHPTKAQMARFDPKAGQALYDLLLADLMSHLTPGEELIIVPDEILGILPFETLVVETPDRPRTLDGPHGPYYPDVRYLGEQFPIRYYQSATTLMLSRTLRHGPAGKRPALVVADPVFDLSDARAAGATRLAQREEPVLNIMRAMESYEGGGFTLPRLAKTERLVESLRQRYGPQVHALTGLDASEPRLRNLRLTDYRYQVYATHGVLDSEVPALKQPALVLNQVGVNEQEPAEDGFLTMSEVMDLKMNAELAALIACNTGLGRDLRGDGVQHMGRAFQYAGTRTVLISLWSVAEEASILLTERFFEYLKAGYDRSSALRKAQEVVRNTGYRHPFYWASFILVGERGDGKRWQPTVWEGPRREPRTTRMEATTTAAVL